MLSQEVLEGSEDMPCEAAAVIAFGQLLFEMATGHRPNGHLVSALRCVSKRLRGLGLRVKV